MTGEVRDAYERWASTYDTDRNPTRDLDAALVQALDWTGLEVVEIGCGTGKNSAWIAPRCRSLVGLDLSEGMLRVARAAVPRARFLEADLTLRWPIEDESADMVLADLVLEHIDGLQHFFAESHRVLRPGGRLRLCELHPERQLKGTRAHFEREGQRIDVPAYLHSVSEFVNGGVRAGLTVSHVQDATGPGDERPRLLVVTFVK